MSKIVNVIVFNVGFGDAIYVRIEDKDEIRSFLIDCGYRCHTEHYLNYLSERGWGIKYIILTHKHGDHIDGVNNVIKCPNFDVEKVIMRFDDIDKTPSMNNRKMLEGIKKIAIDLFTDEARDILRDFDILYPLYDKRDVHDKPNHNSIVLSLNVGGKIFLLTGDTTSDEEFVMLGAGRIDFSKVKYVKIAHHGSNGSTCEAFIQSISSSGEVEGYVSCSKNNRKLPHQEMLNRWRGSIKRTRGMDEEKDIIRCFCIQE